MIRLKYVKRKMIIDEIRVYVNIFYILVYLYKDFYESYLHN